MRTYVLKPYRMQLAVWSSGMILASGARGAGFNSRNSPLLASSMLPRAHLALVSTIRENINVPGIEPETFSVLG